MTMLSATALVRTAKQRIDNLSPTQVLDELIRGRVTLVDLREGDERTQHGQIPGSLHVPRGRLEFAADSSLPSHQPPLRPDNRLILYCASGGRSALATVTLREMGYANVAHLAGGFDGWKASGLPVVA